MLLLPILLAFKSFNAQALQCQNIIKNAYQENPNLEFFKSSNAFEVREVKRLFIQKFFFLSHIENGEVYVKASLKNKRRHSKHLYGKILFDQMIRHYTTDKVNLIIGHWHSYSDNYKSFIEAIESGITPSEAALQTWTGIQAARHGYKYAVVTYVKHRSGNANLDSYKVYFSKDSSHRSDVIENLISPFDVNEDY